MWQPNHQHQGSKSLETKAEVEEAGKLSKEYIHEQPIE
jgi:hypothetical protein